MSIFLHLQGFFDFGSVIAVDPGFATLTADDEVIYFSGDGGDADAAAG